MKQREVINRTTFLLTDIMNLGNTITRLRKEKKITQKYLADRCNVTQAYLSQIENNKKEPNLSTLKDISVVLGIPLTVMFFLSLEKSDVPRDKQSFFNEIKPTMVGFFESIFHDTPKSRH
jgi:transcriptional regulator with XRE-family HTH domain